MSDRVRKLHDDRIDGISELVSPPGLRRMAVCHRLWTLVAGYMKEQGKQKAETATKASKHLLKPGQDPVRYSASHHRPVSSTAVRYAALA